MTLQTILAPIYTVQKQRDEEAHHNLKAYVEQTHRHVQELENAYGVTLRYGKRVGGYETLPQPSPSPQSSQKDGVYLRA